MGIVDITWIARLPCSASFAAMTMSQVGDRTIPLNISNDAPEAVAEEQAVNLLACAFVKLARGDAAPPEVR